MTRPGQARGLRGSLRLAVLALASGVIGCSSAPGSAGLRDGPLGTASSPIIDGVASTAVQDFVVEVVHPVAGGAFVCSGSLVAPNLVLTARHCVSATPDEGFSCDSSGDGTDGGAVGADYDPSTVYVYAGLDAPDAATTPSATATRFFHDDATNICNHDLALLEIDPPLRGSPWRRSTSIRSSAPARRSPPSAGASPETASPRACGSNEAGFRSWPSARRPTRRATVSRRTSSRLQSRLRGGQRRPPPRRRRRDCRRRLARRQRGQRRLGDGPCRDVRGGKRGQHLHRDGPVSRRHPRRVRGRRRGAAARLRPDGRGLYDVRRVRLWPLRGGRARRGHDLHRSMRLERLPGWVPLRGRGRRLVLCPGAELGVRRRGVVRAGGRTEPALGELPRALWSSLHGRCPASPIRRAATTLRPRGDATRPRGGPARGGRRASSAGPRGGYARRAPSVRGRRAACRSRRGRQRPRAAASRSRPRSSG